MFKICFIISDLKGGGAQKVLVSICNYLVKKNFSISIIKFDKEKSFFEINSNIEVINLDLLKVSNSIFDGFFFNIYRIFKLRKLLIKKKPKVVISFIFETNILSIISLFLTNIKLIVSERNNPFFQKKTILWNFLRFIFYFFAKKIVVNNIFAQKYFSRYYRKKVKIINNPLEIPKYSVKKENIILVVSRLHEQKSIHLILIAFSRFLKYYKNWKLEIIGVGKLDKILKELSADLKIENNVHWIGEKKKIKKHYARASIFCLPSEYEGSSNALLEALSYKINCIVSSSAVSKEEFYYKYLSIFNTGDVNSLFNALMKMSKDLNIPRKEFNRLAKNKYSIKKITSDWLKVIDV